MTMIATRHICFFLSILLLALLKREASGETQMINPKRDQSADSQSSHGLQDYDVSDRVAGDSKQQDDLADSKVPAVGAKRGFLRALQSSCSIRCNYNSDCQNGYDGSCPYCCKLLLYRVETALV